MTGTCDHRPLLSGSIWTGDLKTICEDCGVELNDQEASATALGRWFRDITNNPQSEKPSGMATENPPDDPWEHRAANMRCSSCMWFSPKAGSDAIGRCRRHAPAMNGYPVVFVTDWCGDHKLNENA